MNTETQNSAKEMILASRKAAALHIANIKNAQTISYDLVQKEIRHNRCNDA